MDRPPLALHHFTITDATPLELVSIAAETGCGAVCIFVDSPDDPTPGQAFPRPLFPTVTRAMQREFMQRLRDHGIAVTNIEFFPLGPQGVPEGFREKLALGAELGARVAVTHVHDPEPARATDSLGRFAGLCAEFGITAGLEFMGLSPACSSLAKALELIEGAAQPNIGVAIDALHLVRTGGTPAALAAVDPALIAYAQLCDGPALADPGRALDPDRYLKEAFDRLVPGEGVFPLRELVRALPPATHYDVEVPRPGLQSRGVPPLERARRAVDAARSLLDSADPR